MLLYFDLVANPLEMLQKEYMSVNTMKITRSFIMRLLVKLYFLILPNTNI